MHQVTDSYRPAIVALVIFFVLGYVLLRRVDVRQGILDAGNEVPGWSDPPMSELWDAFPRTNL